MFDLFSVGKWVLNVLKIVGMDKEGRKEGLDMVGFSWRYVVGGDF